MLKSFDNYIPARSVEKARKKFDPSTDFLGTLEAAKGGDIDAINILFHETRQAMGKAFFKFLGKRQYWKNRIAAGDDYMFLAEMYELFLRSVRDKVQVLWNFKPTVSDTSEKMLEKFRGWVMFTAQAVGMRLNKMKSSTEHSPEGEFEKNTSSLTALPSDGENIPDPSSELSDADEQIFFQGYLNKLKDVRPDLYRLVVLRLEGKNVSNIAEIETQRLGTKVYVNKIQRLILEAKAIYDEGKW